IAQVFTSVRFAQSASRTSFLAMPSTRAWMASSAEPITCAWMATWSRTTSSIWSLVARSSRCWRRSRSAAMRSHVVVAVGVVVAAVALGALVAGAFVVGRTFAVPVAGVFAD